MKVRCIAAGAYSDELTTGKEYEVLAEIGCYYQLKINDKGQGYQCYIKSRFEVVKEEKEVKEKTFREVIADIKEGEVWEGKCFKVYIENGKINIDRIIKEKISGYGIILDGKFKLQRKQYTFEEAFKAFERGGEIESAESNYKYSLERDGFLYKPALQDKVIRCSVEDRIFSLDEIQSKWYIND